MNDWKQIINYTTEEKLPEIKTLFIGIVALFVFFVFIDNFLNQFISLEIKTGVYTLFIIFWVSFWSFNKFYLPKNKKKQCWNCDFYFFRK